MSKDVKKCLDCKHNHNGICVNIQENVQFINSSWCSCYEKQPAYNQEMNYKNIEEKSKEYYIEQQQKLKIEKEPVVLNRYDLMDLD